MSPVKQVSQKSPSDTEGLVKSLPSGSHQVTADCGLSTYRALQFGAVPCSGMWKRIILSRERVKQKDRAREAENIGVALGGTRESMWKRI